MIILIDNYDSFSYNLYQLIGKIEPDIEVYRNDKITIDEIVAKQPEAIILSPGPGKPSDAGICESVVRELSGKIPILGVCLGHQAICEAFGGKIILSPQIMHGKSSIVMFENGASLFENLKWPIRVGRYHSLEADPATLPDCLKVVAKTESGEIMAVQHISHPTFGLQFHPESVLTPDGSLMAQNFINVCKTWQPSA